MTDDIVNQNAGEEQGQAPAGDTTPAQTAKEEALVPSHRLREEAEKRREAEAKLAETEQKAQQEKALIERTMAKEMY